MKMWTRWLLTALLAIGLASLAAGCGGSDDDSSSSDPAAAGTGGTGGTPAADPAADPAAEVPVVEHVNIAGVWNGTRSNANGSTAMQFSFNQSGGDLQGGYHDSGFEGNGGGTINGDDISMSYTMSTGAPGETWTFSGAVNAAGTSMNGTMTTPSGSHTIQATK